MRFLVILFCLFSIINVLKSETVDMIFVGDIMQLDDQIQAAYNQQANEFDYDVCFEHVKPIFKNADFVVGNLELNFAGKPYRGRPKFSAPDELAYYLKDAGMDYVITANNHTYDYGQSGIQRTLKILRKNNLNYTGTFQNMTEKTSSNPLILEKNGIKIALLGYTKFLNDTYTNHPKNVNYSLKQCIKRDLTMTNTKNVDIIIIYMHWGDEYSTSVNTYQENMTNFIFENGADIIIGSHPHVVQPVKIQVKNNKKKIVAYSLGNFLSSHPYHLTDIGMMLKIQIEKQENEICINQVGKILIWNYYDKQKKQFTVIPIDDLKKNRFDMFLKIEKNVNIIMDLLE